MTRKTPLTSHGRIRATTSSHSPDETSKKYPQLRSVRFWCCTENAVVLARRFQGFGAAGSPRAAPAHADAAELRPWSPRGSLGGRRSSRPASEGSRTPRGQARGAAGPPGAGFGAWRDSPGPTKEGGRDRRAGFGARRDFRGLDLGRLKMEKLCIGDGKGRISPFAHQFGGIRAAKRRMQQHSSAFLLDRAALLRCIYRTYAEQQALLRLK